MATAAPDIPPLWERAAHEWAETWIRDSRPGNPPRYDAQKYGPLPVSPPQRLRDIGGPPYEPLRYQGELFIYNLRTKHWASLQNTFDPAIW